MLAMKGLAPMVFGQRRGVKTPNSRAIVSYLFIYGCPLGLPHTEEKDTIRIISARKADRGERELYEEG